MTWYYVQGGERKGPVEHSDFERLVLERAVRERTLVWREGMADWQPYADVAARGQATAPPVPAPRLALRVAGVACSHCGQTFGADQVVQLGGVAVCADCRPLVLQNLPAGVVHPDNRAEQLRKAHLSHEAYVKSVGSLYVAAGSLILVMGMAGVISPTQAAATRGGPGFGLVAASLGALFIATGIGVRQLRPWSRVASGIFAGIGLCSGNLFGGLILYLLFSKKGAMVFSEPYREVIAVTPHIKYRTPLYLWILLGIVILLFAWLAVGVLSGPRGR